MQYLDIDKLRSIDTKAFRATKPYPWLNPAGLITVEGTGEVPQQGLYDTVFNWDMKIKLGSVDLVFRPGSDRTKFVGSDGWINDSSGFESEIEALLGTRDLQQLS